MTRIKQLVAAAAIAALTLPAMATTIASLRNKSGGQIRLTDLASPSCRPDQLYGYSTVADSARTFGFCWMHEPGDNLIFITWHGSEGEMSTFPLSDFVLYPGAVKKNN